MGHTKGPWEVGEPIDPLTTHAIRGPVQEDGTAELIAGINKCGFPRKGKLHPSIANTGDENAAAKATTELNARLIASAPELLVELERCRELLCSLSVRYQGNIHQDDQDQIANTDRLARSSIAKATGK